MYLRKLMEFPIEERTDKFADLIGHFKDSLKTEKDIDRFAMIYPEWALEFEYVDELKKIIIKPKEKIESNIDEITKTD